MADVMDVHVLDSTKNMDSNVKQISGIPQDIIKLLDNIGASTLDTPRWSVRVTDSKIYLDVAWDKVNKSPAKSHGSQTDKDSKDIHAKPKSEKRRKKSPSTRRRDRLRLDKWRANKRRELAPDCPVPEVQTTVTVESQVPANVPLDQSDPRSASKLPETVQLSVDSSLDAALCDKLPETVNSPPCSVQIPSSQKSQMTSFEQDMFNRIFADSETDPDDPDFDMFCTERCFNFKCMKPGKKVKDGLKKCTRCKVAQYCSRKCQAEHWHMHKTGCKNMAAGLLPALD